MTDAGGSEALVQTHSEICCDDQISSDSTESPSESSISTIYGSKIHKPRALTVSSAPTTTHVDKTYKGRSPCGRYHRARILHDTLRSSLPPPPRPAAPEPESRESYYRLGLRRIFSSSKKEKDPKSTLRPLLLPGRLGLNRTRSYSAPNPSGAQPRLKDSEPDHRRRLSLAGWLPISMSTAQPDTSPSTSPPSQSARLKPLVLPRRSSSDSSGALSPPTSTENMNMLAWLLDCIQRDVNLPLHWSAGAVQEIPKMLLQDGQARCLVVRAKRRSALF